MQPLLENLMANFAQANQQSGVTYEVKTDATIPPFLFDEEVVTIILSNLLSNATKNTEQGTIGLTMQRQKKRGTTVWLFW